MMEEKPKSMESAKWELGSGTKRFEWKEPKGAVLGYPSRVFKQKEMNKIRQGIKKFERLLGKSNLITAMLVGGAKKHALGHDTHAMGYKDIDVFLVTKNKPGKKLTEKLTGLREEFKKEKLHFTHFSHEYVTGEVPDYWGRKDIYWTVALGIPIHNKEAGKRVQKRVWKNLREKFGDKLQDEFETMKMLWKFQKFKTVDEEGKETAIL